jgi:RNA polymerase sigma factor (sigma-70 family)
LLLDQLEVLAPDSVVTLAWDAFYDFHSTYIRHLTDKYHLPDAEQDDVVQEVWCAVLRHLPCITSQSNVRAWLVQVVRSKAIDALRRRHRNTAETLDDVIGADLEPIDPHASGDETGMGSVLVQPDLEDRPVRVSG